MTNDADDRDRVLLVQELDPEHVDAYVEAHEAVPSAVIEAMERGGVERFDLFLHDNLSIGYIVAEDFEAFQETYAEDPECLEWEDRVAAFKQSGVDPDSGEMPLGDRIWSFEREE